MKKVFVLVLFALIVTVGGYTQSAGDLGLVYEFNPMPSIWLRLDANTIDPVFNIENVQGIGVIYHISEDIAIQPSLLLGYATYSLENEPDVGNSQDLVEESIFLIGLEVDLPIYIRRAENVSMFVAPGLRFITATNDYEDKQTPANDETTRYTEIGARVNLGGQATFGRFAVYSSWGLQFDYVPGRVEVVGGENISRGIGFGTTQLSIGLLYYISGMS